MNLPHVSLALGLSLLSLAAPALATPPSHHAAHAQPARRRAHLARFRPTGDAVEVRALEMWSPSRGTLSVDPRRRDGALESAARTAELRAGTPVVVVAHTQDDGADEERAGPLSLELRDGARVVATDEPGAGSGEREVVYTPAHAGTYRVRIAAPAARGAAVRYTVQMYPGE